MFLHGNTSESQSETIRKMVFEVIVKQALKGAAWREICAGPMEVNKITPEEVEEELRRRGGDGASRAGVPRKPIVPDDMGTVSLAPPDQEQGSSTDQEQG